MAILMLHLILYIDSIFSFQYDLKNQIQKQLKFKGLKKFQKNTVYVSYIKLFYIISYILLYYSVVIWSYIYIIVKSISRNYFE